MPLFDGKSKAAFLAPKKRQKKALAAENFDKIMARLAKNCLLNSSLRSSVGNFLDTRLAAILWQNFQMQDD